MSPRERKSTVTCAKVDKSIGHLICDSSAVSSRRVPSLRAAVFISTVLPPLKLGPPPFCGCHCFEAMPQMIGWCLSKQSLSNGNVFFFVFFCFLPFFLTFSFSTLGSRGRLSNRSRCNNHLLCLNTTFRQLCSSRTPSLDSYLHRREIHCLLSLAAPPPRLRLEMRIDNIRRHISLTHGAGFARSYVLENSRAVLQNRRWCLLVFLFFAFLLKWGGGNNTGLVGLQASIAAHKSFRILLGVSAVTALGGELLDEDKLYI